jgi:hypothetical protein
MKRNTIQASVLPMAILVTFALSSCGNNEPSRKPEEFLIRVDSISMPDSLSIGQVLQLGFYGTIGENPCHQFKRFIIGKSVSGYTIKVIGEQTFPKGGACGEGAVIMEGRVLELPVTEAGTQIIEVENPGLNHVIRKELVVVP